MKKTIALFLACFTVVTLSAQWTSVYQDSTMEFSDADFPTAQDGFVLAHNDNQDFFILKTADGGATWTEIALPLGYYSQIAMYSATSGYLCRGGGPGIIFHTNDGFASLTPHQLDPSYSTIGLEVISDGSGFYMNNDSRFRSFNNYGATHSILMDTLTGMGGFDVADDSTVYVGNGTHLNKTTDGGGTWFCVNSTLPIYMGMGIAFVNADTGYYLGYNSGIWRTVDGGVSFQNADSYYGTWIDAQDRFCASIFGTSTIRWSANYGQTWVLEPLGMNSCSGVFLTSLGDCYVLNSPGGEIRKRQAPLAVETETLYAQRFSVFPNPANDVITISLTNGTMNPDARFTLVNTLGETVMNIQIPRDGRVSLEGLAAGMYCYQVWSDEVMSGAGMVSKQ